MKESTRTILAFIVAPAVAPTILGVVAASMRPEGEGPTWVASFAQYFSVAAVVSYAISYTLGTLTFIVLRALRRESAFSYGAVGAMAGVIWGSFTASFLMCLYLGLLGCAVAAVFGLIRGASQKKEPIQPPQTTTGSSAPSRV